MPQPIKGRWCHLVLVLKTRIWSILLIKSYLKWYIHLSRSLFLYSHRPEKHKLGRRRWILASCQVLRSADSEKKSKMSQPIRGRVAISVFRSAQETPACFLTNFVHLFHAREVENAAEVDDKHVLLTVLCIFWSEFGLKPRYFALHLTEKFF